MYSGDVGEKYSYMFQLDILRRLNHQEMMRPKLQPPNFEICPPSDRLGSGRSGGGIRVGIVKVRLISQ